MAVFSSFNGSTTVHLYRTSVKHSLAQTFSAHRSRIRENSDFLRGSEVWRRRLRTAATLTLNRSGIREMKVRCSLFWEFGQGMLATLLTTIPDLYPVHPENPVHPATSSRVTAWKGARKGHK